jgi:hypothetical protein
MSEQQAPNEAGEETAGEVVPFGTFLEEYPLNALQTVGDYYSDTQRPDFNRYEKSTPALRLFCNKCSGMRNFEGKWEHNRHISKSTPKTDSLAYTCRDCQEFVKYYFLLSDPIPDSTNGKAIKLGEYPELNIDIPSSLPGLFGLDYPYFIKGLKCEKQGFGVAAYVYYRRVVENQKNRLLDEIIKVANKVGASADIIKKLTDARQETQFKKALDMAGSSFPETLLVDGQNPFTLLHKALSIGIHSEDDGRCLQLAHNIRVVLTDLSVRMKIALSETKELRGALSALEKFNSETGS